MRLSRACKQVGPCPTRPGSIPNSTNWVWILVQLEVGPNLRIKVGSRLDIYDLVLVCFMNGPSLLLGLPI